MGIWDIFSNNETNSNYYDAMREQKREDERWERERRRQPNSEFRDRLLAGGLDEMYSELEEKRLDGKDIRMGVEIAKVYESFARYEIDEPTMRTRCSNINKKFNQPKNKSRFDELLDECNNIDDDDLDNIELSDLGKRVEKRYKEQIIIKRRLNKWKKEHNIVD